MIRSIKASMGAAIVAALLSSGVYAEAEHKLTFSTYWPTSYGYLIDPIFSFADKVKKRSN